MDKFMRTAMLIGDEGMKKLKKASVAVFGVGGVGSYTAEALARSGIGEIVLIDKDDIDVTNINRQIHATEKTVGLPKVEVMRQRILEINSKAGVISHKVVYTRDNADEILEEIKNCDYIVDAIDMVSAKIDLIVRTSEAGKKIISSMGAGNKLNPAEFKVADIYETSQCPLARVMRRELKARGVEKLKVVYSEEKPITPDVRVLGDEFEGKMPPGSVAFVPSVAGLIIASEVVKDLVFAG